MKIFKDKNKKIKISTLDDWYEYCPPQNPDLHWKDKHSAKEMAKFWLSKEKQTEFKIFFENVIGHTLNIHYALPEFETKFDNYKKPRKNDLCIFAEEKREKILISIEGKGNEPFGDNYIDTEWKSAQDLKINNSSSEKFDRLKELFDRFNKNKDFCKLRYQLTHWFAGTIDEAEREKINKVYMIVQEFHSDKSDKTSIETNKKDLNRFVKFISDSQIDHVDDNKIVGPIKNDFTKKIDLYIGKYIVDLN